MEYVNSVSELNYMTQIVIMLYEDPIKVCIELTLSPLILLRLYTVPYWSTPPFLTFDIRALWHSGLSARVPECQKLKMVG